mmetsp:Transcript_20105/g.43648  ORF Transcript_20105/g.43648 Transcript_20105/m.43648 type:complete len:239 (+) Transcript_20105:954-1670(+)
MCVSTTKSLEDPILLCQAIVLLPKNNRADLLTEPKDNPTDDVSLAINYETNRNNDIDIGITFFQQDNRLLIKSISKDENGWFGSTGCAIKENQIVLGINEFDSLTMSPKDAISTIHSILLASTSSQLSITTIAVPTKWDKLRKAAVAAGGGTLLASGAVLMATPLHPIGHAMALGGVGILGMEFEAPQKVLNRAKEHLSETRLGWSERRKWSQKEKTSISQQEEGSCQEGKRQDICRE